MLGIEHERYRPSFSREFHSLKGDQVSAQCGIMVARVQREGGRAGELESDTERDREKIGSQGETKTDIGSEKERKSRRKMTLVCEVVDFEKSKIHPGRDT